jgi:PAS domain S-box-containing protein
MKAEKKLSEEKSFSDSVINSLPGTFYLFDEHGSILRWNKNLAKITNYSSQEIEKLNLIDLFSQEAKRTVKDKIKKLFEKGYATCEATLITKDGTEIPFFCAGQKITIDNKIYFIGTGTDITARMKAEEKIKESLAENDMLLKEIHHRVKKNLQVICSLFNLQKEAIMDKETYEMVGECQNRIRAIAIVHEKLYQSESLSNINLKEYIIDLINNLFNFHEINPNKIKVSTDIENILLGINSAIPCGLIVNELVNNSLQYAFPRNGEGEINIIIHLTNLDIMDIVISDNGIGLPEDLNIFGGGPLGMQIVDTLIKQLKGRISIDRDRGTQFHITFALKK